MGSILLRGVNWVRRFRHRCGYGVHSPFDYYLITSVIYEQAPFYAYAPLHHLRRVVAHLPHYREKVDRMIFRLANYLQPACIVDVGTGSGLTARYMAEACPKADIITFSAERDDSVARILSVCPNVTYASGDFDEVAGLYFDSHFPYLIHIGDISDYEQKFEDLSRFYDERLCVIIAHPYADRRKKRWWEKLVKENGHARVTFDLYDVGLVFVNRKRAKENHIVNFL